MKKLRLRRVYQCGLVVGASLGVVINTALSRVNTMVAGADGRYHPVGPITDTGRHIVLGAMMIATVVLFLAVACAINKIIEAISLHE